MASDSALIVATEASADRYGAQLAGCLSERLGLRWFGIGGDSMRSAGVDLQAHARDFSVLGIFEVLRHYPRLYGVARRVLREAELRRPKLAVLIDSPGFNLHMCRKLHRLGIPVIYFIAPQLWAWRPGRIKYLQRYVRKLLCIFPFEEEYFRSRGVETEYIGHPLVDTARAALTREEFCGRLGFDVSRPLVTLMPGSRNQEVERHLPVLLEAARRTHFSHGAQFCLVQPVTDTVDPQLLRDHLRGVGTVPVKTIQDTPYNALGASDAAVIASGTATVEALLLGTPMVAVYQVSQASWLAGRALIRTPFYSMVNVIAGERVIPELIQGDFTALRLADELGRLLSDMTARKRIQDRLGEVRERLGKPGAIGRAADAIAPLLDPGSARGE